MKIYEHMYDLTDDEIIATWGEDVLSWSTGQLAEYMQSMDVSDLDKVVAEDQFEILRDNVSDKYTRVCDAAECKMYRPKANTKSRHRAKAKSKHTAKHKTKAKSQHKAKSHAKYTRGDIRSVIKFLDDNGDGEETQSEDEHTFINDFRKTKK